MRAFVAIRFQGIESRIEGLKHDELGCRTAELRQRQADRKT